MSEPKKLSRETLRTLFGIEPFPRPNTEESEANKVVNDLFDAVAFRCEVREWEIFKGAYPDREDLAYKRMSAFLSNVHTCPKKVLQHIEKLLRKKQREDRKSQK